MIKYMVIERFHEGKMEAVYQRFSSKGRLLPDGLVYIDSWLNKDKNICFQLMETDNELLLQEWFTHWQDLVDFEIFPIDEKPN